MQNDLKLAPFESVPFNWHKDLRRRGSDEFGEIREDLAQGLAAMADAVFHLKRQLGHGQAVLAHQEEGIVAEPSFAAGGFEDGAVHPAMEKVT